MIELQVEQQVRLEAIILAFEHVNILIVDGVPIQKTPYEIAEEIYAYVFERKIPKEINYN